MASELLPNENKGEVILYQPNETIKLEVRLENETVWLTQAQMVELFNSSKANISEHIKNVYQQGELDEISTVRKFRTVRKEGNRQVSRNIDYYNLDMIISVGYRVNTVQGVKFRQWANQIIKQYLLRGYALHQQLTAVQDINMRIDVQSERLLRIEDKIEQQQQQIDFFIRTNVPPVEGIFYEGQVLDARLFAEQLIKSAQREVILIDGYIDASTFSILEQRNANVVATIYTEHIGNHLTSLQQTSTTQTGRTINLLRTRTRFHDRFLIIDEQVYHIGASLKDLGKRLFAFSKLEMSKSIIMAQL